MADDESGDIIKFPLPKVSGGAQAALKCLSKKLGEQTELKCKALSMSSVITWPGQGVKVNTTRMLKNNIELLQCVAPFLNETLTLRKIAVLSWLLENVVYKTWKAGFWPHKWIRECIRSKGTTHVYSYLNEKSRSTCKSIPRLIWAVMHGLCERCWFIRFDFARELLSNVIPKCILFVTVFRTCIRTLAV